jgi:glycerol-3-phosphate cytidylyltransferase
MKKILYTGGTFDLPHYGHLNFLKQCSKIADEIIVSLNTDEFIYEYKKNYPIMNYEERKKTLEFFPYIHKVIPNIGGIDSKPAIVSVKPDFIAIGDDWAKKDYYKQMQFTQEWLDENNIVLIYLAYTTGISSSEIKNRILNFKNVT